jgi:hypothetical protein
MTQAPSLRWGEGRGEGMTDDLVIGDWNLFDVWLLVIGYFQFALVRRSF